MYGKSRTTKSDVVSYLRAGVGNPKANFRPGQWEAIDALVNRNRQLIVVERTGWGKSMVYFLATRILRDRGRGPTLLVSPLLALMRNQLAAAERVGVSALTINSANKELWRDLQEQILHDKVDVLLISPERLANEDFVKDVLRPIARRIALLVVDEAHCISDWGHDFRPDYRRIVSILKMMPPNMPVLGTTATANSRVLTDIQDQLGNIGIQRGALMRESLTLQNMRLSNTAARLAWLAEHLPTLPGSGIVYVLTKRDANIVANWLTIQGIPARAYYANVEYAGFEDSNTYRTYLENMLLRNGVKTLVATIALGMGFDKPDMGFVIHFQAPGSIVAYYQQVGRAGRAIPTAFGILMSGSEDDLIHTYFRRSAFPREEWVNKILMALEGSDGLTVGQLCQRVNLRPSQLKQVLKYLSVEQRAPVYKKGSRWNRTPVKYKIDRDTIERLTRQRELEWSEVQAYIDASGCLMRFLAESLDDEQPKDCGKCASCQGKPVVTLSYSSTLEVEANHFIQQAKIDLVCKLRVPSRALPVYRFPSNLRPTLHAEEGRILSVWGDAGWGKLVAEGKRAGWFRDELVSAAAHLIRRRWKPSLQWVTCVPSQRHSELVPNFASRLAEALRLPFKQVVVKVRNNEPQKLQQNQFHRCRNLDGVFAIRNPVRRGPVLLIDDVVDSTWTLTVVAALLRQAGTGPVFPFALTSAAVGG